MPCTVGLVSVCSLAMGRACRASTAPAAPKFSKPKPRTHPGIKRKPIAVHGHALQRAQGCTSCCRDRYTHIKTLKSLIKSVLYTYIGVSLIYHGEGRSTVDGLLTTGLYLRRLRSARSSRPRALLCVPSPKP